MTKLLEKAISELTKLPDDQQDALAAVVLEELADEKRWGDSFARSQHVLLRLAQEAREDEEAGRTEPLDNLLHE